MWVFIPWTMKLYLPRRYTLLKIDVRPPPRYHFGLGHNMVPPKKIPVAAQEQEIIKPPRVSSLSSAVKISIQVASMIGVREPKE